MNYCHVYWCPFILLLELCVQPYNTADLRQGAAGSTWSTDHYTCMHHLDPHCKKEQKAKTKGQTRVSRDKHVEEDRSACGNSIFACFLCKLITHLQDTYRTIQNSLPILSQLITTTYLSHRYYYNSHFTNEFDCKKFFYFYNCN